MKAFHNAVIFDGDHFRQQQAVLTEGGIIVDLVSENSTSATVQHIDLKGNFLAPAFMDLQIYGGNGKLFSHELSLESIDATYEYCLAGGTSQFLLTMATLPLEKYLKGIEVVKEYWQQGGKGLLGLHLEGPFIHSEKRGAHLEDHVKKATLEDATLLVKHGKDVIKLMTLAPELCDDSIIQVLRNNGIVLSAGHSNATYQQAFHKFNSGISVATHLFNAMPPLHHRSPGLVGAIYAHPTLMSSIVPDGIHVDFAMVSMSKKIMKERLFLITDAVTATTGGEYQHMFQEDRYVLSDGTLSGSALSMMRGVRNCVEKVGIELEEALRMASLYPATAIGKSNEYGKIAKGHRATFVVFDKNLRVVEVLDED